MGWSGLCPNPLKGNDRVWTNGGQGKHIIGGMGGGPKPFCRGVLWCVFPASEFFIPLCRSLNHQFLIFIARRPSTNEVCVWARD